MRQRTRNAQEEVFPITEEDWRDARHDEDPADRQTHESVERAIEMRFEAPIRTLNTRDIYKR